MEKAHKLDHSAINKRIAANRINDRAVINRIEKILIHKRGYVFNMPKKRSPVIVLMSGGLDTTVVASILLKEYGLQVYPLFINRMLPHEKRIKKSLAFFSAYFRRQYPGQFHDIFEMKFTVPPAEVKDVILRKENDVIKYQNRKGVPLQPSFYANYGVYYAKYLEEVNGVNVRTIVGAWLPSNSEWYGYESFQSLRAIMLNLCCMDDDFSWQFTSLPMEKELGYFFDKDELVRIGTAHRLPLEKTWTCYKGERLHCGTCPPCSTRMKAFHNAGIHDNTAYGDGLTEAERIKKYIKMILPVRQLKAFLQRRYMSL
ncbi:7-cyano-7-deazaguanine synthase [Candidatus Gottesmanbacteria bacterium]|nr:7-cyano-7-deazaguanine synthase [Candidatus Gottesmanbacteria bacterium]